MELDCTDLGACAQEIVLATLQATATLQDSLLFPGALAPGVQTTSLTSSTALSRLLARAHYVKALGFPSRISQCAQLHNVHCGL